MSPALVNLIRRIRGWLFDDRIRIAPDEGRLLNLQIGQRLILNDSLMIVVDRQDVLNSDQTAVRYCLETYNENDACLPAAPVVIDSPLTSDDQPNKVKIEPDVDGHRVWMECSL
ncbi:hypothetical protein [Aporhodopirellula aestuarii]|uniref:Uncharacterized protein n=1 Tax=Aporhodopirellula aestuarii TaxID=2950107 RepID=A0ABT0U2P2_9BACT|nr:hypothetical protein [Aporhodopirellula aestuarii]MCM2371147.1 hypothetical protein [Aporhodopirellula aestuarii]